MVSKSVLAALTLAALSTPALAQTKWYIGASVGESDTSSDLVANRESTVVNATVVGSDFESRDTGLRFFGGYRFSPNVAVELNYADLGQHRVRTHILTANPPLPGSVTINRQIEGFGADLVLMAPLGPRFTLLGRVGVMRSRLEAEALLDGNIVFTGGDTSERRRTVTHTENTMRYGFGGEYSFSPSLGVRAEWERYQKVGKPFEIGGTGTTGEADTDFYSVSLVYRF